MEKQKHENTLDILNEAVKRLHAAADKCETTTERSVAFLAAKDVYDLAKRFAKL